MADEHDPKDSAENNPEYPKELKRTELNLLRMRRGLSEDAGFEQWVGFGLSGGGIRSATFCLGIFQGLAKQKLLSKIDYISTVSGGGYFGAFYGRLFTRDAIKSTSDIEDVLAVRAANEEESSVTGGKLPEGKVFRWLRENGRYLAPSGSGDVLLGGAVMLRNFIAVHFVLWTFVIMIFLAAQLVRGAVEVACRVGEVGQCWWWTALQGFLTDHLPGGKGLIWWSPYAALAGVLFLVLVIPPAWCYWLVEKPNRRTAGRWIAPFWGWLATVVLSLFGIGIAWAARSKIGPSYGNEDLVFWCSAVVLAVAVETMIWGLCSGYVPSLAYRKDESNKDLIFNDETVRLRLSLQLRTALVATGVVLAFVVIDSIAQTLYGAALLDQFRPGVWMSAIFGPLFAIAGLGRTIVSAFSSSPGGKRFKIPVRLAAGAAAFIITALLLITIDAFSYAIAWKNQMPLGPRPDWTVSQRLDNAKRIEVKPISDGEPEVQPCGTPNAAPDHNPESEGWQITAATTPPGEFQCGSRQSRDDLAPALGALAITVVFSFLFGWSWPFLNRSTHQPIYTSRLIRAYLGASNPVRLKEGGSVTATIADDDINQEDYWPRFKWLGSGTHSAPARAGVPDEIRIAEEALLKKGMPLHLVNVTINETLDPLSNIEQRDRKGTGMAIGPVGVSVGVLHHLILQGDLDESRPGDRSRETLPAQVYPPEARTAPIYRVFRYDQSPRRNRIDFGGEFLTLGNWTGISGAAFSTSLGWRTSLALSLLAGLANVRLTYWWNSGVKPLQAGSHGNWWREAISLAFESFFSVQKFFLDELLARYRGTARQWWPLSDGGHFENLGGYELIRRRLPVIVIIDAEADPDYTFEGLSNLVRKARLDFGAEIKFLSEEQLDRCLEPELRNQFGTLEQLKRGVWLDESSKQANGSTPENSGPKASARRSIDSAGADALSLAHAALAEISYGDNGAKSQLLYIKPTLIGDEPADVHRYHAEQPSFPHETTLQQFFDEAQWESYRKLGEHIALKVFRKPTARLDDAGNPAAPKLSPYKLLTPE
jgi:hypothetical protein